MTMANPSIDEAALDRAVRKLVPLVRLARALGVQNSYARSRLAALKPDIIAEYHRQRNAPCSG